jgi:outer membrane murein-binding lipoprotein Lpp
MNGGSTDHQQLQQWANEVSQLNAAIDQKTARWIELSEIV